MKKQISFASIAVVLFVLLFNLSSCEKDSGKLPNIGFKTGGNYTSADVTKTAGDTIVVGISASKAEDADILKTLSITKSVNGAAATTLQTITLTTAQQDTYSQDFTLTAGAAGTASLYTFTVSNRDGLINSVHLTLTGN